LKILITAGPTREPLDPVRFLSNRSSGEVGFALARAAREAGHDVLLVLGPVGGQPPTGVEVYGVETTEDMYKAVLDFLPSCDAVICAAAVADYRPAQESERKLKRGEMNVIELVENPDIAAAVGECRGTRPLIVFALETDEPVENARSKLAKKNGTLCVLNHPDAIGAHQANYTLVYPDGRVEELGEISKDDLFGHLGL
jgi:phosphopantothenoylcysteine decarboxylase/phosphopantothenate--cysteine ligase